MLSAKRPYTYKEAMNVMVGFSYPIVIKRTEGYNVKSESNIDVNSMEIYPRPVGYVDTLQ